MVIDFNFDAFSHGQIKSKLWLCDILEDLHLPEFQNSVFLGSWYGLLPFLLLSKKILRSQNLTMVDLEKPSLEISEKILDYWRCEGVKLTWLQQDAHQIDYKNQFSFSSPFVVFNTSCEHMQGLQWFDRIPPGTQIILQGTNMKHPEHIFPFSDLSDFESKFSNGLNVQYSGKISTTYPHFSFDRFMLIGVRK